MTSKKNKLDFVKSNLFTGFVVLLPATLLLIVLLWIYGIIERLLAPIAQLFGTPGIITTLLALIGLIILIFLVGMAFRTNFGSWFYSKTEKYVLLKIPGYKMIKDITKPFTGKSSYKDSFKSVALVNLYENSVLVTAFVTDKHVKKGYTTVFIPTGPNPTSGQIVHLKNKFVHPIDVSVDKVLASVIAVGSGSKKLIDKMKK